MPVDVNIAQQSVDLSVRARTLTAFVEVPGIGVGAAYADGDAVGTVIEFPGLARDTVRSGSIQCATYYDLTDGGIQVDLHLFTQRPANGTDNNAYAPADEDILKYLATLSFSSFFNLGNNQISQLVSLNIPFVIPAGTTLYGQAVARGALTVAASNLPRFRITTWAD